MLQRYFILVLPNGTFQDEDFPGNMVVSKNYSIRKEKQGMHNGIIPAVLAALIIGGIMRLIRFLTNKVKEKKDDSSK